MNRFLLHLLIIFFIEKLVQQRLGDDVLSDGLEKYAHNHIIHVSVSCTKLIVNGIFGSSFQTITFLR